MIRLLVLALLLAPAARAEAVPEPDTYHGDPDRPVVIFCRSDCWMSWNAARRAVEWGFDPVIWFPGGTDAWEQAGQPLVTVEPVAP